MVPFWQSWQKLRGLGTRGLEQGLSLHTCDKFQRGFCSGGSRGGSGGSNEPPLVPKSFHFHGEFQKKMVKLHKSNPAQLI